MLLFYYLFPFSFLVLVLLALKKNKQNIIIFKIIYNVAAIPSFAQLIKKKKPDNYGEATMPTHTTSMSTTRINSKKS